MSYAAINDLERKVLRALYLFYREFGPGATPNMKGFEEEAGIMKHELEDAVRSLLDKRLIEFWELGPAIRLSEEGLQRMMKLEGHGEEKS